MRVKRTCEPVYARRRNSIMGLVRNKNACNKMKIACMRTMQQFLRPDRPTHKAPSKSFFARSATLSVHSFIQFLHFEPLSHAALSQCRLRQQQNSCMVLALDKNHGAWMPRAPICSLGRCEPKSNKIILLPCSAQASCAEKFHNCSGGVIDRKPRGALI